MKHDVVVLGGGIAGLVAARTLRAAGRDVVVLEERGTPGGNLRTETVTTPEGPWLLDLGPQSFGVAQTSLAAVIGDAGIGDRVLKAAGDPNLRFLWRDGRLREVPGKPQKFLVSSILPFAGRMRMIREIWVKPRPATEPEETLAAFCDRRLGRAAREKLLTAVIGGIYAGDPERLGAESAFPAMVALERQHGSLIRAAKKGAGPPARGHIASFVGGMQELPAALARGLGAALRTDAAVADVASDGAEFAVRLTSGESIGARRVVVAAPAHRAAALVAGIAPSVAKELAEIHHAPVAVVHIGFPTASLGTVPPAFGFLVPRNEGLRILGCIFSSILFPGRAPEGHTLFTVFVGGDLDPAAAALDDDALRKMVTDDLSRALGARLSPSFFRVTRWPRAIPQYWVGHRDRLARIDAATPEGVAFVGNWRGGIAMENTVQHAGAVAAALLA